MILLFALFGCYMVLCEESSGLILLDSTIRSDLDRYLYKFYEIEPVDRNQEITVALNDNTTDAIYSSVAQGDIVEFYITKEVSGIGVDITAPTTDETVWNPIRVLTNNPDAKYDSMVAFVNGISEREIIYTYTLVADLDAGSKDNGTYKLRVYGYICNEFSNCAFTILKEQDDKPWMWIILGILAGSVVCLAFCGYCVCCLREFTWWYEITKTPKLWLKLNIKECGEKVIDDALVDFVDGMNDRSRLKFLQWVTELDIKFSFTGIMERNGKEVKIYKNVSEVFIPAKPEEEEEAEDEGQGDREDRKDDDEKMDIKEIMDGVTNDSEANVEEEEEGGKSVSGGSGGSGEEEGEEEGEGEYYSDDDEYYGEEEEEEEGEDYDDDLEEESVSDVENEEPEHGSGGDHLELEGDKKKKKISFLGEEIIQLQEEGEEEEDVKDGKEEEGEGEGEAENEVEKAGRMILFRTQRVGDNYEIWIKKTLPDVLAEDGKWTINLFKKKMKEALEDNDNVKNVWKRILYMLKTGVRYYFAKGGVV